MGAVKSEREDVVVDALCCLGQKKDSNPRNGFYRPTTSPALVVGCGLLERKLARPTITGDLTSHTLNPASVSSSLVSANVSEDLEAKESGGGCGSASSFVENLNTLNRSTSSQPECIIYPPPITPGSDSDSPSVGPSLGTPSSGSSHHQYAASASYRCFLLVYKIEELQGSEETPDARGSGSRSKNRSSSKETNTLIDSNSLIVDSWPVSFDELTEEQMEELEEELSTLEETATPSIDLINNNSIQAQDDDSTNGGDVSGLVKSMPQSDESYEDYEFEKAANDAAEQMMNVMESDMLGNMEQKAMLMLDNQQGDLDQANDEGLIKAVSLDPPHLSLFLLQCIRLPSDLDYSGYAFHCIMPLASGDHVLVVLNKTTPHSFGPDSIFLLYTISFTGAMTGLSENPVKQWSYRGAKGLFDLPESYSVRSITLLSNELGPEQSSEFGFIAFITDSGCLKILNLDTGDFLYSLKSSKTPLGMFTHCAYAPEAERIFLATDAGQLAFYQIVTPTPVIDESIDDFTALTTSDAPSTKILEQLKNDQGNVSPY